MPSETYRGTRPAHVLCSPTTISTTGYTVPSCSWVTCCGYYNTPDTMHIDTLSNITRLFHREPKICCYSDSIVTTYTLAPPQLSLTTTTTATATTHSCLPSLIFASITLISSSASSTALSPPNTHLPSNARSPHAWASIGSPSSR